MAETTGTDTEKGTGALTYRGTVYPWQCDHIGHLNVMWYVGKFDEATWNLFTGLGLTPTYLRGDCGMAAVQQNISYKRELMPGDTVTIHSRILESRDKVVRFVHEMTLTESGTTAAVCELTCVHMDRAQRKSMPFPAEIAAKIRERLVSA